jgi:N-acetylneuraminic acid mutarotase
MNRPVVVLTSCLISFLYVDAATARQLSLDERVQARRAIEAVYWRHRIWPTENPTPKPALDTLIPPAALRARVEDSLRKSNALDQLWRRAVTGEQLQAELNRMTSQSKRPEVLGEIFQALGNDPLLIAEALARPALTDRLLQRWQASKSPEQTFSDWWAQTAPSLPATLATAEYPFTLPALPASGCEGDTWRPTFFDHVDPGFWGVAVWTGSEMIVWRAGNGARYSPVTDSWAPVSTDANTPTAGIGATAVWSGTEMILWGGGDATGIPLKTGGRYNPTTDTWASTSTGFNCPSARSGFTAVWTGSRMIVWGGLSYGTGLTNSGGSYNPLTNSWTATRAAGPGVPSPRYSHTAVWTGSRMVVWGGVDDTAEDTATGGRYDPATNSWTATSTGAGVPSARHLHTAVWTGNRMIVWGGTSDSTGGRYDPASDTWAATSIDLNLPFPREYHTAISTGTQMIIWGGEPIGGGAPLYDGARYDPAADQWIPTSMAGAPFQRARHTAVWTGTEMIVWGGKEPVGGRYDPVRDSWVPTAESVVPAARTGHVAVWTGAEMIVWGGTVNAPVNSGGRYDPATDIWRPTSTGADVPSPRTMATAVWTGTEMIVWGNDGLPSGGRYDPVNDKWAPTSLTGAPVARSGHSAVWTGSVMIIWGGASIVSRTERNDGGRYDPAADHWSPTSTAAGVPAARLFHTAVWTGTEMIVWGGMTNPPMQQTQLLDSGGRYNPSSNSWTPTVINASTPTGRFGHTAVWTGSKMIVWGGGTLGVQVQTGGVYHAAQDLWTATSTAAGVPSSRSGHSAVWAVSEMIVWGGSNNATGYSSGGGRYDPSSNGWIATPTTGAPSDRDRHTAIWTGEDMIVWGGASDSSGGLYCAPCKLYYADADGDRFGNPQAAAVVCGGPPSGYVSNRGDCNDSDPAINPDALEVCDGLDDDCDLLVDEGIAAPVAVPTAELHRIAGDQVQVSWAAVPDATAYDVVWGDLNALRTGGGDFASSTVACVTNDNAATTVQHATGSTEPAWYLVRPVNCGGHGTYSTGVSKEAPGRDVEIAASGHACP